MVGLPEFARTLCEPVGARLDVRPSPANYPLPGYRTFGFAYVEDFPGFDPAQSYPGRPRIAGRVPAFSKSCAATANGAASRYVSARPPSGL